VVIQNNTTMNEKITILKMPGLDNVTISIPGVRSFTITTNQLAPLHRSLAGFVTKELETNPHLKKNLSRLTEILREMDSILEESKQIQTEKGTK